VVIDPGWAFRLMTMITLTSGTAFIMWLGEQITERGIGNGISLIIFAGIVARMPRALTNTLQLARTGELNFIFIILLMALMAGMFFVETPSAEAVDLGCAYTLDVDADGAGLLRVEHGWVGFRDNGRESFIPQGAMCATRRGRGPGTPYYSDAPPDFVRALAALDFGGAGGRAQALEAALSLARSRDALSLWHLLTRTRRDERGQVFDRLSQLAPPPAGVTREGVLAGNHAMLDAWWDTLGLESASWWRMWETPWAR
jgi:hypothetical protein